MSRPASLEEIATLMASDPPKQRALGLIIQAVKIAQCRGAYTLEEASQLLPAILAFSPSSETKAPDASSEAPPPEDPDASSEAPPPEDPDASSEAPPPEGPGNSPSGSPSEAEPSPGAAGDGCCE